MPLDHFGRYEIIRDFGHGGMAIIRSFASYSLTERSILSQDLRGFASFAAAVIRKTPKV